MQALLEVKQVAELLGTIGLQTTERTLRRQIISGKLAAKEVPSRGGRGGMKYLVPLSSLPPSAQAEYLKLQGQSVAPPALGRSSIATPPPAAGSGAGRGVMIPGVASGILPPWAQKKALARADLVHAWHKAKDDAKKERKTKIALSRFLAAYNSGVLLEEIFKELDTVSQGTLYRWEKTYIESGNDYRALAPEWGTSKGSRSVMAHESTTLLNILLTPQKRPVQTAIRLMKYVLEEKGIPSPSSPKTLERHIKEFMDTQRDLWVLMREGEKALNDKVSPYIKRDSSMLEVGDVLITDGHRLNFLVINPWTGKPCRATLIGYIDWASRYLCGYEIMIEETTQVIAGALRNAILTLGKFPRIAYQDNGKSFRAKFFTSDVDLEQCGIVGLFGRLGIKPVFSRPYNAQAKIIERFWGTFGDQCERMIESFTGASIEDKPTWMMRNEKFHKQAHGDFVPSIPQAVEMIGRWLKFHHSQPHKGLQGRIPAEVFAAGRGSGIDARQLDYLMMSAEVTKVTREGIRWRGLNYWHDALYGYAGRAEIRYSVFDVEQVHVYLPNGGYLCSASLQTAVPAMAALTGSKVDMEAVSQANKNKAHLRKQTIKTARAYLAAGYGVPDALVTGESTREMPRLIADVATLETERRCAATSLADKLICLPAKQQAPLLEAVPPKLSRKLYQSDYEKYEDLKGKATMTKDERGWLERYEKELQYA